MKNQILCAMLNGVVWMLIAIGSDVSMADDPAATQVDFGTADFKAWSGSWWPHRAGGLQNPLAKYDTVANATASKWEKDNHPSVQSTPQWHGFCHAWAASSVLEREPTAAMKVTHEGKMAELSVGDQKGWLAACHTMDIANVYGDRFGDKEGCEDRNDIAPDVLWRLLQFYIRERSVPLILDVEAGEEVWNYPVYAYHVFWVARDDQSFNGELSVEMADNSVAPGYVGIKPRKATYEFDFQMESGAIVPGSAHWVGASVENHPDFAWYPYVAVAENPEVNVDLMHSLMSNEAETAVPEAIASDTTEVVPESPVVESSDTETLPVDSSELILLSPPEMLTLVTNETSDFFVDLQLPEVEGQRIDADQQYSARVISEEAGYVYLFTIDSQGELTLAFPQSPIDDNRITQRGELVIGGDNSGRRLVADGSAGPRTLKVVVTTTPVLFSDRVDTTAPGQSQQGQSQQERTTVVQETETGTGDVHSAGRFRFNPSQAQQIQQRLLDFQKNSASHVASVPQSGGVTDFGEFGQDRAMFHVNAKASH